MTEQAQPATLSVQDIAAAVQIIDIGSQRGAFRGSELSGVGTLRDRLVAFLNSQGQEDPAEEPTPEESEASEELEVEIVEEEE